MRRDLREIVLPAIEDEYVRSLVIAMVGILGELPRQLRSDEAWCAPSVEELQAACERWSSTLGEREPAPRVRELAERALQEESPQAARRLLLAAASAMVAALWDEDRTSRDAELLRDVRHVLGADLAHQLARGDSPRSGTTP